jgi:hypothetical protein
LLQAEVAAIGSTVVCTICQTTMVVPDMPAPLREPDSLPTVPDPAVHRSRRPFAAPGQQKRKLPSQYYIKKGKTKSGPYTSRELRELAASGKLLPTDRIWKKGFRRWRRAAKARGLFPGSGKLPKPPTV